LNASLSQFAIEKMDWGAPFDLVVRDSKTGFAFFNVEGNLYDYDANAQSLSIKNGRLLISEEFAEKLGDPAHAGAVAGNISITATMQPIEITELVNGEPKSSVMPPLQQPGVGTVPGPDVIVGDLNGLAQFGSAGTQVGLAVGTDSCNAGIENLNWFALPNNDHPVIPQNLYRMSGGTDNNERFEQIGPILGETCVYRIDTEHLWALAVTAWAALSLARDAQILIPPVLTQAQIWVRAPG
jgi:hypothetical protein